MSLRTPRVRFAPSPTGYLHVGGARTALYNFLFARNQGGTFILRVEDTDTARSTREHEEMQKQDLRFLGILWDEGPDKGGDFGPYRQSERQHIYKEYAEKLLERGDAYYCFCSDELLEKKKEQALKEGRPPQYDRTCLKIPLSEARKRVASGEQGAVRFYIREQKDHLVKDLIRGDVEFKAGMVGDFVILRSGGMPVYNFCCVVDDGLMKITHVLRAEEHLSNTVRQLMLYEAFGWTPPQFGHMSVVLGPDRQKLSKRHGATSVNEYKEGGYLPSAINNYIVLLGWSSPEGKEVLTPEELVKQFGVDRINSAPAMFDVVKLKWMNSVHLRALPNDELWKELEPFLKERGLDFSDYDEAWRDRALEALKSGFETLKDAAALFEPLADNKFEILPESKEVMSFPTTPKVLDVWIGLLEKGSAQFLNESEFMDLQKQVQAEAGVKGKELFQPLRVAVVGKPQGTELKHLVPLLPRKSLIRRATVARQTI